jgi:CHAT domain-containing protein
MKRLGPALLLVLALGGCGAVYVANQVGARSGMDPADLSDLDTGNLSGIRDRYEQMPPESLPPDRLALLCDVLLKYQELGRASDCLDELDARLTEAGPRGNDRLLRALPGKKALLALALGRPELAAQLTEHDTSLGGRYVFALASIRTGHAGAARPIADALRKQFEPGPVFYAASLYAALGDFPSARAVLEDPERRLLVDYGLSGHADVFGGKIGAAVFRLDVFDEFDFGVFGKATLAPAANIYVEYLAAVTYLRTGGYREAERRLDVLLAAPAITAFRDVYWRALSDRADVARRAGDAAAAERLLRQSIDVIESIRGSVGAEAARIAVVADKEAPYRRLVDLLERRGDAADAVVYAERAHSRALVELLAARYRFGPSAAAPANRLVAEYDRRQGELQLASVASPGERAVRLTRIGQLRRQLLTDAPDVADLVSVSPVEISQIQRSLGAHEAALVYFPGETQWHVFTITADRVVAHDVPADAMRQQAGALRLSIETQQPGWRQAAALLYHTAVAPALDGVAATALVIVPSGPLHYVPFAALGDGDQLLLDRFALRVVPNLGLITRPSRPVHGSHALVVGDPLRGDPDYALPFAETEARDVAGQLGGATLLLGGDATVPRFLELAAGADLIHFAGHAVFNEARPLDSGLLFARPDLGIDTLRARQLYDLRTNAALAFLSACQTGVNSLAAGEDLMGMERGFFSAGVTTVIASLWPVQDKATSMLAHEFYRALLLGAPPSRALQSAQLAVRRQFPQPVVWSGFVVASVGAE